MATKAFNPKNSSNIQRVEYVEETKVLVVTFKNAKNPEGQAYKYDKVPPIIYHVAEGYEKAGGSVGQFVNQNVVGFFQSEKL